jgi:hypothetical protein
MAVGVRSGLVRLVWVRYGRRGRVGHGRVRTGTEWQAWPGTVLIGTVGSGTAGSERRGRAWSGTVWNGWYGWVREG